MKKCLNCNKEFEDSVMFCSHCGSQLTTMKPIVIPGNNSWATQWAGTIAALVGLTLMWEVSWIYGFAIVIVGACSGTVSPNIVNKVISWIGFGVATYWLIAYII